MAKPSRKPNLPADAPTSSKWEDYYDELDELQLRVDKSLSKDYDALVETWKNCERCPLHGARENVVFARGTIPAQVLFIGEAPGQMEDAKGFPFVGPSGNLLNTALRTIRKTSSDWDYAVTNPVGCIPWDDPEIGKIRKPLPAEIFACNPRFVGIIKLVKPKGIILLGKVAEAFWKTYGEQVSRCVGYYPVTACLYHPAFILRNGGASEANLSYTTFLSGLKQFVTQTIKR